MRKAELIETAEGLGIDVDASDTKAKIVEKINAELAESEAEA